MRFRFFLLFGLLQLVCYSQLSQSKWYFGNGWALDFASTPPSTIAPSSMTTNYGSASVADANGNLLFYTDGNTVWNQSHSIMANGTGILASGIQNCVILKRPGSTSEYYLFTNHIFFGGSGLYCSTINITLAAGLGSVTVKNQTITSLSTEDKLNGTQHCNGVDYWIVVRLFGTSQVTFHSYLVTSAGVSTVAVISSFLAPPTPYPNGGAMKFSPNGRKMLCANLIGPANGINPICELYDFDPSTGIVSNRMPLLTPPNTNFYAQSQGVEFSPDGSKAYCAVYGMGNIIVQWDLCAGSTLNAISSSSVIISTLTLTNQFYYGLQLAIDGKIYARISNDWTALPVINNPNAPGLLCNYLFPGPALNNNLLGSYTAFFLPNFIKVISKPQLAPFTYTADNSLGCQVAQFNFSVAPVNNTSCTAAGYSVTSYSWNFGDPLSGNTNTSTLQNPIHQFSSQGTFTTQLIVYYSCGGGTDTLKQVVQINTPCISVSSNSVSCSALFSATAVPTGSLGPYTYTWLPSNQTGSSVTGLAPGSQTVLFSNLPGTFTGSQTIIFNPVVPFSGSVIASASITCNGAATGTGQISNLAGGSGNQTYLWTNGIQSYTTAFTNSLSAGIWSVIVTDALTGCQVNQSFLVTQPPPLSLLLSTSNTTLCAGTTTSLSALNSGGTPGYTYTWTNEPPGATAVVSQSLAGVKVYTCTSTDANNCLATNTIAVNYVANPVLSIADVSICPLAVGTLSVSGASTYSVVTPFSSTPLGLTGNTFTDSPSSTSQYTIIGSANTCTSSATGFIILYPLPIPQISSNAPKCEGTSMFVNASGGNNYQWSGPNGFNSIVSGNSITPLSLVHAGVYNLTVTSVNGCTASASASIVVNPIPTVSAAGSTVCTTQTMSLFANSVAGANYLWNGPLNYISSVQNPTLPNPVVNRTGTYTVKVTSAQGCTNAAVANVSVTTPPSLTLALSSPSLCYQAFNGSPNTITLTSQGANTYTLYAPNLIGTSTPVGPSASLSVVPPFASSITVGTATLEGSNGICSAFSTFVYTVIPNPTVSVNSATPVICAGQNFIYTSNGANSYTWSATSPNYTTYSNGGVAVAHPSINAVFSVYGSSLGCQSALITSSITVYPLPTLSLSAASKSICLHDKTTLTASGTASSYLWMPVVGINNNTLSTVIANPNATQIYTVIASVNNCTTVSTLDLTVLALPQPSIIAIKDKVCINDNVLLQGSGGISYNWKGPMNVSAQGTFLDLKALHQGFAGQYTLTATDINSCKSSTTTMVEVLLLPTGYISNFKENVCAPYCNQFNFSVKDPAIQSSWSINNNQLSGNKFFYCFNIAGTYAINGRITDANTNCKSDVQYILTVNPKPEADFIYSPLKPIENLGEVIFTNTSQGEGLANFSWFFNDNKGYTTKSKNASYLYSEPGTYPVAMIVSNRFNCSDTISKAITVEADFSMFVPNAFTPNDDNRNDIFLPVIRSTKLYDLKIYDRWGQLIFHSNDLQQGWDGTFRGEACKQDVYNWKIELSSVKGERLVKSGTVMLMR